MTDLTTERYINPYTDFGFKKLFGTEMNKDLLISFLNALPCSNKMEIEDVQYLNSEHLGDGYGDRRAVFDVYCQRTDGGRFIVEMQKAEQAEIAQYTPEERREYEASVKNYWDYYSTMKTAVDKAKTEGRAEGRLEERIANARSLKENGVALDLIARSLGLTATEIAAL